MSVFSWQIPGPPTPLVSGNTTGSSARATPRATAGGFLDQLLDPVTLDCIDSSNGEWIETADSRTIFLIMAETRLGRSYSAPADGTRIAEYLEIGDPVTPEFVATEYQRIAAALASAGVLRDFQIRIRDEHGAPYVDQAGRFSPVCMWTDLATGSTVDNFVIPI